MNCIRMFYSWNIPEDMNSASPPQHGNRSGYEHANKQTRHPHFLHLSVPHTERLKTQIHTNTEKTQGFSLSYIHVTAQMRTQITSEATADSQTKCRSD